MKRHLLAPGPTPIPPEVLQAMAQPIIHHRAPEYEVIFADVLRDLRLLFQRKNEVLMFAAVSDKAWALVPTARLLKYYFNFTAERKAIQKEQSAYTPAVSLVVGLRESLRLILAEGLGNVFARHDCLARAARAGVQALGLDLFAEHPGCACTTVKAPAGMRRAGHEHPGGQYRQRRRAHAVHAPQPGQAHSPGHRLHEGRQVREEQVPQRGAVRQGSGHHRPRPHR
jgi:aspartate aminotransferase-like enzyme